MRKEIEVEVVAQEEMCIEIRENTAKRRPSDDVNLKLTYSKLS